MLQTVLLTKLVVSVVLILLTFSTNSSSVFLTLSFFTLSLSLLKSTEVVSNLPISNVSTLLFKLLKPLGSFSNLSKFNLSTSDFELARSSFLAKSDVSIPVAFFNSDYAA